MWYLIRLNNKKDKERAEEALRTSQWSFLAVSSLIGAHQPQSAIVSLLNTYVTDSYLISDEGIVFSQYISCEDTAYFAVDTQDVMFYRVEVWDTTLNSLLAIGNPVWNTDYEN